MNGELLDIKQKLEKYFNRHNEGFLHQSNSKRKIYEIVERLKVKNYFFFLSFL